MQTKAKQIKIKHNNNIGTYFQLTWENPRKGDKFGKCSQGSFSFALKTKAANSAKTVEMKNI